MSVSVSVSVYVSDFYYTSFFTYLFSQYLIAMFGTSSGWICRVRIVFKWNLFISEDIFLGNACEWDISSGNLIDRKVPDGAIFNIDISGDKMVTHDYANNVIRVFNLSTCLLVLRRWYCF
jgi:hypothetical protein